MGLMGLGRIDITASVSFFSMSSRTDSFEHIRASVALGGILAVQISQRRNVRNVAT